MTLLFSFFTVLCFSLGYIANDLVRESGVKFAGSALASPIPQNNGPSNRRTTLMPGALAVDHKGRVSVCDHLDKTYVEFRAGVISLDLYMTTDKKAHTDYEDYINVIEEGLQQLELAIHRLHTLRDCMGSPPWVK